MSETPEAKTPPAVPVRELTGRIGKYDIVKPLGRGAMGMVYLAHDTILERDVALKVMVAQIADDPELKHRFEREAKAVAKMTHPNVVNVFDLGSHTDGSPFIAMELLKGQDLQKAARTPPPMSLERKVSIIVQVLAGLAHAHKAGIIHRDIKPANIFINHDGAVKIMDFGVARLTTASMTGTGNIVGTADYMSPEQVKGAKVDGRSDVFSVGCMLYELLAGRRPFHAENLMAIFYKITHEEANFDAVPAGPEYDALLPILKKALAKNLEDRYQTAYDFAVDLREYLKTHGSAASENVLEQLADLGSPPSSPPQPLTDAGGPTLVEAEGGPGATMELGPGLTRPRAPGTGTARAGAATVVGAAGTRVGGMAPTVVGGVKRAPAKAGTAARPIPAPMPRPVPARGASPVLYGVVGALVVGVLALGGYVFFKSQATPAPPQVVVVQAPTTTAPPATTLPPPPTTAPPPTMGAVEGKAAAALKAADAAFRQGDYDRAVSQAQTALREDPGNVTAQKVLGNAVEGQKAAARFRAADAALGRGDYAAATTEAEAGRAAAPWDSRGPSLLQRIQDAQRRAEQQAQQQQQQQTQQKVAAQLGDLLGKADAALTEQKYDAAISLYDSVLNLDPQNQRAILGKSSAVQARAVSQAATQSMGAMRPPAGKAFVPGKTQAQSPETAPTGGIPGFEESAGVAVKKGTQAADLPGKIGFDIDPATVKPGDKYTVKVSLLNEGNAPIQVKEMIVATTANGRRASGPVTPLVKEVAPQQRATLREFPDVWKEETTTWTMEVTVKTIRGETYKNQVTWR
jgi:tRNA A-37 threonylcarbamoyl transferase component Bud32/tetratricopeptide (TPR) repeat protein